MKKAEMKNHTGNPREEENKRQKKKEKQERREIGEREMLKVYKWEYLKKWGFAHM